ncbi:DTW domain-containing protein [Enterovibrio sp. ZSDZ42]|uniref:tRNA-uridine aminocarboxypropyltransferase n=1 Tax=Enterovibrio gelatinilyticus TaxID=2899819 RepID=A0ABT5QZQ1_9GAMM|nr:tRNA-uridine aminocarboxypropyltransferase [Enterovibrio sp. ZSDZ42]MDD1793016.1 DTW domain-containing protein [Enterovibrio sp. ZSDZ42]
MNKKASRYCEHCGKANKACICHFISRIDSEVPVIVLQHPSEVNQPIGTARILSLSLPNCVLFVGEDFSEHAELNAMLAQDNTDFALLYPSDNATSVSCWQAVSHKTRGIILLDGTWRKAFKMYQLSRNLHDLPAVKLDDISEGNYRIRKSPVEGGLSTVEAGYHALSAMTGDTLRYQPLLTAFDGMIEYQISQMPPGVYERHYGNKGE